MPDFYDSAFNRSNPWGDIVWGDPNNRRPNADAFAIANPQDSVRDAFAQLGHSNRITNPWVDYISNVAPAFEQFFYALSPNAQQGQSAGFADWMQDFIGAQTMPGAGNPLTMQTFQNTVGQLLNGQGGLANIYSQLTPDQQISRLNQLATAMGALTMGPLAQNALVQSLAEKASDFNSMVNAGITEGASSFLPFLQGSGWFDQWF